MKKKFQQSPREKMFRRIAANVKNSYHYDIGSGHPEDAPWMQAELDHHLKFLQREIMTDRCNRKNGGLIDYIPDVPPL